MNLTSSISKGITVITLIGFLLAGCATLPSLPSLLGGRDGTISPARTTLSRTGEKASLPLQVTVITEEAKPLVKQVLRKGQVAQMDGILFDKESSKRILADLTELKGLRIKVQIQEQIVAAYEEQRGLLRESNDLMAKSNEQYRKEIESQRRWAFLKSVLAVLAVIAGITLGGYGSK